MRGPGGGVGPVENVAEDGVGGGCNQDEAGAEGDAENKTLDDKEEMDTDGDDVHFGFVMCRKCKSCTGTFWCRFYVNQNIFQSDDDGDSGGDKQVGDLDGAVALQNVLQENIDANEEGGAVGHSSEPQPSTSGCVPPQGTAPAPAPAQTKQDKNTTSDSGKGNSSYESMVRNVLVGRAITLKCTQLTI